MNTLARLTFSLLLTGAFSSCQTQEQKPDEAFEHVKEQKMELKDSTPIAMEPASVTKPTAGVPKTESQDDWTRFKADIEKKTIANEMKIKALKQSKETSNKTFRRITHLEKENTDLKKQIDDYVVNEKMLQAKFKTSISVDVKEIESDLNDMTPKGMK